MSTMTLNDIRAISDLVMDLCGVYLDESKDYLIESRLREISRQHGCDSFNEFAMKAKRTPSIQIEIVDAITTNETLFFRDDSPFSALQNKAIPETIDAKEGTLDSKKLRVWSAACSTGQEPYSIAMTLSEIIPNIHSWDVRIHGSDVSRAAVEKSSRGIYSSMEIGRGMPAEKLRKYFTQESEGKWRVCDEIRSLCSFETRNLTAPMPGLGPFDIVFCRNVAIYFTPEDRKKVFLQIAQTMTPKGYLFVGSSESLSDLGPNFGAQQHCRSVFYQPNSPKDICAC